MRALSFVLTVLLLLGCTHVSARDGIIDGLPHLKDPAVLALEDPGQHLVIAMEKWGRLRAYVLESGEFSHEVELDLPPLEKGYVRWGPCLYREGDSIYFYSGVGKFFKWPTYRIRVARCDVETDLDYEEGRLVRVSFHDEQPLDVFNESPWPEATADGYGLIDPEVIGTSGGPVIYYTIVSHGIPDVRYHQEFIVAEQLSSPTQVLKGATVQPVYAGWADPIDGNPNENVDDGVAEAPTIYEHDGRYFLFFSSYPTDHHQYIAVVESTAPMGKPWTNRRPVASKRAGIDYEAGGIGGQAILDIGGVPHFIYQGLQRKEGKKTYRLATRPVAFD